MGGTYAGGDVIAAEEGPAPFTQVPDWLLLSGCSAQAFRMYVFLAAHIDPRDPVSAVPCPKQVAIARAIGLSNEKQVGPYGRELERLGALRREKYRYASGMRNGYRYFLRFNPPSTYSGPVRMKDFYDANPDVRFDPSPGRMRMAVLGRPDGGTENSTPGGTKNSTSGGTKNRNPRRTPHSTSKGATHGTPEGTTWSPLEGAAHASLEGAPRRSAEEDQGEADQEEAENPPPPPSVTTAEDARGRTSEEGAASPRDLPRAPGGTAGAPAAGGPDEDGSADQLPTTPEQRHLAMARDVVARLPRWLQPGDEADRQAATVVIAVKLTEGYPVPVVLQELSGNPPGEPIAAKARFIGARLRRMAPWVPPARAATDRAALDEINARKAQQAGAPAPDTTEARAAMAAARERARTPTTQQQEADGGPAAP
jgi:hypothetical protein